MLRQRRLANQTKYKPRRMAFLTLSRPLIDFGRRNLSGMQAIFRFGTAAHM